MDEKIFFQGVKSLEGNGKNALMLQENSEKWQYVWYAALRFYSKIATLFDRLSYDFLLVFQWKYISILYRFGDINTYLPKI